MQGIEYQQAGFTMADSVYGTVFFCCNRSSWVTCYSRNFIYSCRFL
jgi:hypothetical protein